MPPVDLPDFTDLGQRARAVHHAQRPVHPAVLQAIQVTTPAQQRSLEALKQGVAVVTGQQAGLFGGPLYTLHKAAAAIVNARAVQAETGVPCAPVFWLQNEDHDFDEIRTVHVLSADGELVDVSVQGLPTEDGCSIAHRQLGPSIEPALDALEDALEGLPHAEEVVAFLRSTHSATRSPCQAFVAGIERLFAGHGLLVVDPMHPALVEAARPLHLRAIQHASSIADALRAHTLALEAAGRAAPIHVRSGPLSFVHPDGLEHARFRVEPAGDAFRVVGRDRTLTTRQVQQGPHTTSALLRPVLQDSLLPTAAYVGGPGELRYLAQLPPLWAVFDLPVPLVVPRARFVLIDTTAARNLERLNLTVDQLSGSRDDLLCTLDVGSDAGIDPEALQAALTESTLAALDDFLSDAVPLGLGRAVEKTRQHVLHGTSKLVRRYKRTLATRDATTLARLDGLLDRLQPLGVPQERVHPWPSYAARLGIDALVQRLIDETRPFDGSLREVRI